MVKYILLVFGFGILLLAYSLHTAFETIENNESLTDEERLEEEIYLEYVKIALMNLSGVGLILGSVIALFLSYISPTRTKEEPSDEDSVGDTPTPPKNSD